MIQLLKNHKYLRSFHIYILHFYLSFTFFAAIVVAITVLLFSQFAVSQRFVISATALLLNESVRPFVVRILHLFRPMNFSKIGIESF